MKKTILLGFSAVIAFLLVVFGPALIDLYHLQTFVSESAEMNETDGGQWPRLTDTCIMCHGIRGNSLHQGYPSLAGQPAAYIATQLRDFAAGRRANPTMGPFSKTLTDSEIKLLADYFSRQPVAGNRYFQPDPQVREQGEELVEAGGCIACHGEGLMGRDQSPRLAGQGYDYLLKQLDAFAAGERSDPTGLMNKLVSKVSVEERKAMASFLANIGSDGN